MDAIATASENVMKFKHFLDRVTYKPGSFFRLFMTDGTTPHVLVLLFPTVDTYGKLPQFGLTLQSNIRLSDEELADAENYPLIIKRLIKQAEDHEMDEWLRVDGVIFDDPHKRDTVVEKYDVVYVAFHQTDPYSPKNKAYA